MNRRFRAGELSHQQVAQNLKPIGNVDRITSPGDGLPPAALGERTSVESGIDLQRAQAVDALHTYIVAAVGYDHRRALLILNRVMATLSLQLDPVGRADHRP